ncbi:amino acid adenylation domain-containing protein [Sinirhodobacter populi]|uniref:Amino acid adenylation domain-containing protein n=1 Tax=Paenirhodobacter populi TaxID=2306993 RepID=A0A443KHL4_9RHOB|nr:non-ribosomal peptide synthetase [Sinirhodobacter populi]RWR32250.1 amino acid adenylation domain-containing protein [Sinirhodobacter populi]
MRPVAELPLTEAQEGLWYAQALDRGNPVYMTGQFIALTGPLDRDLFRQAFDAAVAQSPALRLRFALRDGRPVQWLADAPPALRLVDLRDCADPEAEARARMTADDTRAPDLALGPVAEFTLYTLGAERYFWHERIHHLATDGFAFVLFTNRVGEIYSARVTGRAAPAAFPDLAQALEEDAAYRASDRRGADRAFWLGEMRGLEAVAGPAEGRAVTARAFNRARLDLEADLCAALRARAKRAGVNWPDALTILTAACLARVSGEGERVFGLPFMARLGTKAARVPCMWMNVLPFRCDPDQDAALDEVLQKGAAHLAELRRHGRYRSEQLRRDLRRTAIEARLYGPLINVQPFDMPPKFAGLQADLHILGAGAVDDLTATFRGDAVAGLSLEIDTNPALYTRAGGEAHAARLAAFLRAALAAERLADVPTVTGAEAAWLAGLNATDHPVPDVTLTELIERQMRATPDAPAVVFGDTVLSYAELDRRSAALAAALRARGAGPEAVVAVALPRSEHLAVALVATLRAGAAYVPLDPDNPPARLAGLIARTGAVALLAEGDLDAGGMAPFAPADWPAEGAAPAGGAAPGNLAYILFTSGSTGEPKGVMIEHRAIVNRLLWMRDHYGIGAADRILQKTPTTFDVSVWELFLPYLAGASLVFAPPGAHRDPTEIARLIRRHGITTMHFVPSMLSAFLDSPASEGLSLTRVFCSGEALTAEHRARFHARLTAELHNLYGPTEAAVDVTYWDAGAGDSSNPMPIGHPVWNTQVHVLDRRMRVLPPGVRGDLYLGGVQLARGYLGRPDLTAERFVPNPFGAGRLYATGDVAMLRADGAVVYLGRSDHQVKIRGMRIEPGEIEVAIRETGLVRDTVVLARADRGADPRLVAYVLADAGFAPEALSAALAGRLPAHMVPAAIVALDAWPMTVSGKLDRKALPAPVFALAQGTPPEGPVEARLADLFRETLHLPDLPGREADFFTLGGDSLSAVALCLRIDEVFGRDPGLGQLFETPTIAGLARAMSLIDEARSGLAPVLPLGREGQGAPLFILHPAGGLGWCYRRLARAIRPLRPVYALQSPLLEGGDFPASLSDLAADYLRRIEGIAPDGVIHLAGWSVGGILAQEIAVQARAQGRRVGLVALLDAYPAECWRAEPEPDPVAALRALLAIAGHDPDAHPELDSRAAVVGFLRQGGTPLGSLPEPVLDAVVRLVTGTNRLIRAHHERRYDGTLTHIRAARDHAGRGFTADLWTPYAARIQALDLPLLHAEMVSQPAADRLGPQFAAWMAECETAAEA